MSQSHKEKLTALKTELTSRIEKINKDFHSRQTSSKFSEQVVTGQNDEVLHNLKNEAMFELEQIERALTKLAKDSYGNCEKCHNQIDEARLDAVPYAMYCKSCAA